MSFAQELLAELGLEGLPEESTRGFCRAVLSELEMRVGNRLVASVTPAVLATFPDHGEDAWLRWMHTHTPQFKEVAASTRAELMGELAARREEILAALTAPVAEEGAR
jgi:hypothetical protein